MTGYDLICIGIIIVCAFFGYRKGAINTLINLLGLIASFVIARLLSPRLTELILSSKLVQNDLIPRIMEGLATKINGSHSEIIAYLNHLSAFGDFAGNALTSSEISGNTTAALQTVLDVLAQQFIQSLAFLIIFILCIIVFGIFKMLGRGVNRVPVVGTINRVFGGAMGLVVGGVLSLLIIVIIFYYGLFTGDLELIQTMKTGLITAPVTVFIN